MEWGLYWFMLPVSIVVAVTANLSGIGGTALFTPIFLLVFPLLGPGYPLEGTVTAFAAALITATFGFSSGFVGYARARLVDYRSGWPFAAIGAPAAVLGATYAHAADPEFLKGIYAGLMLVLAAYLLIRHSASARRNAAEGGADRVIRSRTGTEYRYAAPRQGAGVVATGFGGLLTGMVSVGMGEVVMPQLVRRNAVPVPVAAATSVLVVVIVFAAAAITHAIGLMTATGARAIPWHLLVYTVPGVVIGGQLGPRLQGRVPQAIMVRGIAVLFVIIGVTMGLSVSVLS